MKWLLALLCLFVVPALCFVGCQDPAIAEEWQEEEVGSYIGSGAGLVSEPEAPQASPVRYERRLVCNGTSCSWVDVPVPDTISTPQAPVMRQAYQGPVRRFGSRLRGFFRRVGSRLRGC